MRTRLIALLTTLLVLAAPGIAEAPLDTLSYGSQGDAVTHLQERLAMLGYYTFRITGVYQENTREAVRAFQADNGLDQTGTADDALQRLILSDDASPRPPAPYEGRLRHGSSGDAVKSVQTRLKALGYYADKVSGSFLDNTRQAVRDFQKNNGLGVDGVVGDLTWQALFDDPQAVHAAATPRPTPEPTPVPYRIGVDITNQITTVYGLDGAGAHTVILKRMLCSTGTEQDPTPPGTYSLPGNTSRWCFFPKWGTHGQYWTKIDAYNAFHSVIYSEANSMALKTGSYTGLGKRASHGCIRLMLEDAKWIYDNCGAGTEVFVYEGAPDEELVLSQKLPPLDKSVMLPEPTPQPTAEPAYDPYGLPRATLTLLSPGMESDEVYWLQCRLRDMGYYQGAITGGYYGGTTEAVRALQRDRGLEETGRADAETLLAVYEAALLGPTATPWIPDSRFRFSNAPDATPTPQTPGPQTAVPVITPRPAETDGTQTDGESGTPVFFQPRSERGEG